MRYSAGTKQACVIRCSAALPVGVGLPASLDSQNPGVEGASQSEGGIFLTVNFLGDWTCLDIPPQFWGLDLPALWGVSTARHLECW